MLYADILLHAAYILAKHPNRRMSIVNRDAMNLYMEIIYGESAMRKAVDYFVDIFHGDGESWRDNHHQTIALCLAAAMAGKRRVK